MSARSATRIGSVLVAAVFAVALSIAPPAVRTALAAADPLRTQASTTYTLDPEAGRVHVAINVTETDLNPNSAQFIYFYTSFGFALQSEATNVRVSGGSANRVTTKAHASYVEATVHITHALFYRKSTSFTIRYEIAGGKPRSDIPTRIGAAFSTFAVWAWGDVGHSTLEVRTPKGFETRFDGDAMQVTTSATTGTILRAKPAAPSSFFTIVTAEDGDAFTETRMSLAGGVEIVVQSWPEDVRWKASVTDTLRDAMPELRTLIGLDWPVAHDLNVRERYTPDLEGYAGFFLTAEQRIEVSEDLDPSVIAHEASHAWFNDSLFLERWIYEGLAQEYAWRALTAVGGDAGATAEKPDPKDPGFVDLEAWTHPGVINDKETDDRERYGYQASFWVIHSIAEAAGLDQMRSAFKNAAANLTAYPGAPSPETVLDGDSWRRLLDLTEPLDAPDPAGVEDALSAIVLASSDEPSLEQRHAARDAYRTLVEAGDGWLPGWYIRRPMGDWDYDMATTRIAEATAVLALRDQVATAASALGLEPDGALRTAYEAATAGLRDATDLGNAQLSALAAIALAKARIEDAPDLVTQVGLLGATPVASYDAARAAFAAGDTTGAAGEAGTALSIIAGAAALGQQRLMIAGLSTVAVLLLLFLLVWLLRRRRRRARTLALATASASTAFAIDAPPPADAVSTEPYATLAAHPGAEPPPPSASPPDHDGGQAPG